MSKYALLVSIVRKGWGSTVLEASVKAGARGGTVLSGRGAGINEQEKIFGMSIEPEKEIVLTIVTALQVGIDMIAGPSEILVLARTHGLSFEEVAGCGADPRTMIGIGARRGLNAARASTQQHRRGSVEPPGSQR